MHAIAIYILRSCMVSYIDSIYTIYAGIYIYARTSFLSLIVAKDNCENISHPHIIFSVAMTRAWLINSK